MEQIYVVSVSSKDGKTKTFICNDDVEMLIKIKEATDSDMSYSVYKAQEIISVVK